jgi:ribosomal protein S18 acetylase RimI-like enzyme
MQVRPLQSDDLPEVSSLVGQAYSDILLRLHGRDALAAYQPRTPAMLGTLLELGPGFCFVGEDAGRLTGAIFGRAWGSLGWFSSLAILPEEQGRGYGRMLATASIDALRAAGCRSIGLETWPAAAAYTAMYVRLGFRPVGLSAQLYAPVAIEWPAPAGCHIFTGDALPAGLHTARFAAAAAIADRHFTGLSLEIELTHAEATPGADVLWLIRDDAITGFAIVDTRPDYDLEGPHADLRAALLNPATTDAADFLSLVGAAAGVAAAAGGQFIDLDAGTPHLETYRFLLDAGFHASGQLLRFISADSDYPGETAGPVFSFGRWST